MDPRVVQAINLLSEDFNLHINFEVLARSVNLSPSRMRHLFKEEVGMTPAQYLKMVRIKQATDLLENSFLQLKEVMSKVGLSDESHFVKDFKKLHGLPPIRYRQHYRRLQTK